MPDTKDFHGMKNILLDNEDWMVVDPLDYEAFVYYAPENFKDKWNQFRDGDTYFVIDKDKDPIQTSIIHKEDGKIEYYGSEVQRHRELNRFEFESDLPDDVKSVVDNVVGQSDVYKLLIAVKNGEKVTTNQMDRADDLIYGFRYNETNPMKSMVKLRFDDMEDYLKLFDLEEYDVDFANSLYSYYDSYTFVDYDHGYNEWNEGYLIYQFSDENLIKFKQIIRIILPSAANLEEDSEKEEACKKIEDMFSNEIDYITSDWVDEQNVCRSKGAKEWVEGDVCDYFNKYGIIRQDCFYNYYTTVGILLSLYNTVKDKTLGLMDVLKDIGHRDSNIGGWDENRWDIECTDFDDESFNRDVKYQLDKILEKIEDSDDFVNVDEYSNIYDRITKQFSFNYKYKTKSDRDFFIRKIDPATNKIIVQVYKKEGGLEERSYTEEEFNNFLVSPELFENKKRRKVISEQTTGNESINFISALSKIEPTIFNTKKPLMYLQNKLGEYKSKNPGVTLDMNTLVKQLSTPQSPFKFTTFNIQTYEPKRISTFDVNLKNIGFTLTKSNIDPMTIQGGVKLKF